MRFKAEVLGQAGLTANIYAANEAVQRHVLEAVQQNGAEHRQRMFDEAPKDTWFMANRTRLEFSENGYTYAVGYHADDFTAAGLPFYPPFLIFGTSKMQANDFMFRATEPMRRIAGQRIGEAVKAGLAETTQ